jgi:sec-independent protein translocase protein TatB
MFGFSFWEIGVAMVVALVVLGPKRLPALARSVSKAMRSLQRASSDLRNAVAEPLDEVRQPLQQMRDDLVHTVTHFERRVRRDMEEPPAAELQGRTDTDLDASICEAELATDESMRAEQVDPSTSEENCDSPSALASETTERSAPNTPPTAAAQTVPRESPPGGGHRAD